MRFLDAIAMAIRCSALSCALSGAAHAQAPAPCADFPKETPKAPYTIACSGKSECTANDTLTVTASSSQTDVIETMCLDFGEKVLLWLPAYQLDKPPQPPLSYPLAPVFTAAIVASGTDKDGKPVGLRGIFQRAVGGKLAGDVIITDRAQRKYRQALLFDVSSLWASKQLALGTIAPGCVKCEIDGALKLRVPGLDAWRQSVGVEKSKVQLVLDGTRMVGLVPTYGSGSEIDSVSFKLQRLHDKPDSVASWDNLLKSSLAKEQQTVTLALADDRAELATGEPLTLKVLPFGLRIGLALAVLAVLLVAMAAFGRNNRWSLLRDDFELPRGIVEPRDRKFSLGKVQMAAWSVAAVVGFVLIGLGLQTVWVLNEINETLVILLGISVTTAAGAMALVPEPVTRRLEMLKTASGEDREELQRQLSELVSSAGPLTDILRDVGSATVSLHRLQNLLFTAVLIAMFLYGALTTGSFPNFSGTLLALMGVSGGAYLGFKAAAK